MKISKFQVKHHLNLWAIKLTVASMAILEATLSQAQSVLPQPPQIGSQTFNANDPIGYLVGSVRYIIFLGLTMVVVFAILAFSGGLVSEISEARKKGEWGRFAVFFGAGILVIVVVIFGAWWGSERLNAMLSS